MKKLKLSSRETFFLKFVIPAVFFTWTVYFILDGFYCSEGKDWWGLFCILLPSLSSLVHSQLKCVMTDGKVLFVSNYLRSAEIPCRFVSRISYHSYLRGHIIKIDLEKTTVFGKEIYLAPPLIDDDVVRFLEDCVKQNNLER